METYLATTKDGYSVYVDLVGSHASTHFDDDPLLIDLVREALGEASLQNDGFVFEKDFGRIVGETDLVETPSEKDIIYAKRKNRDEYTRFTLGGSPKKTAYIAVILKPVSDDKAILISAWIGRLAPPFPGDKNETHESREFWASHALVWGKQAVDEKTINTNCPW